jgi:hypothetical protein
MPEGVKHPRLDLSLLRAVPLIALLDGGIREPEGTCVLFLEAGMVYMPSLGRRRPEPALYGFSENFPARELWEDWAAGAGDGEIPRTTSAAWMCGI